MSTTPSVRTTRSGRRQPRHQPQHQPRHRHSGPPRRWGGSRRLVVSLVALLAAILALNGFIQASGAPARTSADKDLDVASLVPSADPATGPPDSSVPAETDAGSAAPGAVGPGAVGPGAVGPRTARSGSVGPGPVVRGSGSRPAEVAEVTPRRSGTPAGAAAPRTASRSGAGPSAGPAGRSAATGSAPAAVAGSAARSADRGGPVEQPPNSDADSNGAQPSAGTSGKAPADSSPQDTGSAGSGDDVLSTVGRLLGGVLGARRS